MALVNCPECGKKVSSTAVACPECGYAVKEHFENNNVVPTPNKADVSPTPNKQKKQVTEKQKKVLIVLSVIFILLFVLIGIGSKGEKGSTNGKTENPTESTTQAKSGEDYELQVWDAFWTGACSSFGVEYSDYKMTHTTYDYISDSKTSDGYTAHYYLIQTAYETENVFGKKTLHKVTARCYYVPEYSNDVYVTYVTLDGEKVLFDEEKEDWLLGLGSSSSNNNNESTTKKQDETTTQKKVEPTKKAETTTKKETQTTEDYNYFPDVNDSYPRDEILTLGPEDFEDEDDSGDLDGIVGQLPDDLLEDLLNASN